MKIRAAKKSFGVPPRTKPGLNMVGDGIPVSGLYNLVVSNNPATVYEIIASTGLNVFKSKLVDSTGPTHWETIEYQGFVKFNKKLPANSKIVLQFHLVVNWGAAVNFPSGLTDSRIGFYETVSWDPTTLCWNNKPAVPTDSDLIMGIDFNYQGQTYPTGTNVFNSDVFCYEFTLPVEVEGYAIWMPSTPPNFGSSIGEGITYAVSLSNNGIITHLEEAEADSISVVQRESVNNFFFTERILTTAVPHGLTLNDFIFIRGVNGTPTDGYDIDPFEDAASGVQVYSIIDDYTFSYLSNNLFTESATPCRGNILLH